MGACISSSSASQQSKKKKNIVKPRGSKRLKMMKFDKQYRAIIRTLGKDLTTEVVEERIAMSFKRIDTDGSGEIDESELMKAMSDMGFSMTSSEAKGMIKEFDEDNNGQIDLQEYRALVVKKLIHFGMIERAPSEVVPAGVVDRPDR